MLRSLGIERDDEEVVVEVVVVKGVGGSGAVNSALTPLVRRQTSRLGVVGVEGSLCSLCLTLELVLGHAN
jgi:hypothetical protein